ncbi:hypothetical protein BZB76_0303 [Actinomadura pelletieri DSM 43383]|uniref:Uncharacterized protein n=1 Tax=Actinomadura pelletieri DSM 43383 TaxID=1120940 RepID=A0A495QXE8_9ACTN|nr:hypothetical protein BZB76_0303 [Actinomadura pelletieri DSM 43383]
MIDIYGLAPARADRKFAELICADDQWLCDRFDALVAAIGGEPSARPGPPAPPPPPPTGRPRAPPPGDTPHITCPCRRGTTRIRLVVAQLHPWVGGYLRPPTPASRPRAPCPERGVQTRSRSGLSITLTSVAIPRAAKAPSMTRWSADGTRLSASSGIEREGRLTADRRRSREVRSGPASCRCYAPRTAPGTLPEPGRCPRRPSPRSPRVPRPATWPSRHGTCRTGPDGR